MKKIFFFLNFWSHQKGWLALEKVEFQKKEEDAIPEVERLLFDFDRELGDFYFQLWGGGGS